MTEDEVAALEELAHLEVEAAKRASYKFDRYFPDCTTACTPMSARVQDHVIRPGDKTPICRGGSKRSR